MSVTKRSVLWTVKWTVNRRWGGGSDHFPGRAGCSIYNNQCIQERTVHRDRKNEQCIEGGDWGLKYITYKPELDAARSSVCIQGKDETLRAVWGSNGFYWQYRTGTFRASAGLLWLLLLLYGDCSGKCRAVVFVTLIIRGLFGQVQGCCGCYSYRTGTVRASAGLLWLLLLSYGDCSAKCKAVVVVTVIVRGLFGQVQGCCGCYCYRTGTVRASAGQIGRASCRERV
jgi:hypothetical protein